MRYIGLLIVFVMPLTTGLIYAKNPGRSLAQAEGFASLIAFIRYRISAFLSRQSEIFDDFENKALENCGFLAALRGIEDPGERTQLGAALSDYAELLSVDSEVLRLMGDFSSSLGRLALAEQIERCSFYSAELEKVCSAARTEAAKKARLCRLMGAAAGLFFAILLI